MAFSPTVRRRILAAELCRLRAAANLSITDAAALLDCAHSKISRIESCFQRAKAADVIALCSVYGADAHEQERLVQLAKDAGKKGWWQSYGDALPDWFETYVGLEAEADSIRTYEVEIMPGLLQTESYARATTQATVLTASSADIEKRVQLRLQRQHRLTDESPMELWAVMGEAAIRRPVGGHEILREQLQHVLALSDLPNVTVQVMPLEAGGHPAMGPFVVLSFPEHSHHDVVYLESQVGGHYLEEANEIGQYTRVMEHLRAHALDPHDSLRTIQNQAKEL
ncbi:helix-turn-helix domain-containing protein [Haloactinomyces albus]|uniref:Transcriptional regulator with XRE-family HTH domain n=1 Tax=Haloactinomyces albus TaxID=1352928 RepID=A0AAE3ZDA8_9ACTN|nr:helix-turn-helix transcriptional regulator [Haloactinomyces albus]MDR7301785.1 transcriptional regulator with XRE-family HTH domain [Haloactinomyces albus]